MSTVLEPSPKSPSPLSSNNAPLPRKQARKSRFVFWLTLLVFFSIPAFAAYWFLGRAMGPEPYKGPFHTVDYERLKVTIVERGNLESAENRDIVSRVKVGNRTSMTIKWVVDNGKPVRAGEKLVEIEDSQLQEQLKTQLNVRSNAKAAFVLAEEELKFVMSQNFSEIESAKTTKVLSELDLKKLVGEKIAAKVAGFPERPQLLLYLAKQAEEDFKLEVDQPSRTVSEMFQNLNDIEGRIEIARSDREMWLDRYAWSQRMVKKGYLSRAQADADKARLDSSEFSLKKVQGELDIFRKFMVERNLTDLWSKLKESERALVRIESQANSKEIKARADLESKRSIYFQETAKFDEITDEIEKCTIRSPDDGIVVYYVSESARFGSSNQGVVEHGAAVKENQKLMSIPNLKRMLVNVRVHEAMVSRLRGDDLEVRHFPETLDAALTIVAGSSMESLVLQQTVLPTLQHKSPEFKAMVRHHENIVKRPGQKAFIRIDAFQAKAPYQGHVKAVATVASQADFMSDVKVYQTLISIDEDIRDNLKPGMSAEVTIEAASQSEPALTVPVQAVLGNITMGENRKVFVLDDQNRPHLRDVVIGMGNDRMVEVRSGLEKGERVVLNVEALIGERSELKVHQPTARRGIDLDELRINKKGKGGGAPTPGKGVTAK